MLLPINRGFTILEILIAIAIIGITGAIGVPIYQQASSALNLNAAARDLASDLRLAQQSAVTDQKIYAVNFNLAQKTYFIINTVSGQTIKTVALNSKINLQSITGLTDNIARFVSTGAATEAGAIVLSCEDKTSTIEIKPSGYVKIQN